ncbi:RNA helicase, DEAD-box type, Q motif,Helicase, C-terminal,ATP-dependent RNA helicase DEAD-box, conserved [Cinara cedri]|uniref:RNA helicase n=1 Tax=Cinara cedri TaxID=506608 RepID=A0A5E4M447_9HEMI|nr:RNA helicase, DEAD-box type, Q motif,Helicase, C-terminal,ATP-dependent RNA helicase DEAD-box, conserved [Cinara cedri]
MSYSTLIDDSVQGEYRGGSSRRSGHSGGHGRGYFNNRNNDEEINGNDNYGWEMQKNDQERSSRPRGGRGGGGRGRGGERVNNRNVDEGYGDDSAAVGGRDDQQPPASDKPRPTYIPPEITDEDCCGVEAGINFNRYEKIAVNVSGDDVPRHIESFKNSGLREVLLEKLIKCNYTTPTPIQKYSIPIINSGRDLIASAQTGSGKTAAFVLPIVNILINQPSDLICDRNYCEPQCVILAPTRELAIQIRDVVYKLTSGTCIKQSILYGGTATSHQRNQLNNGVHIIVATLGRIVDFIDRGIISFRSLRFFVLDEADRMLDMGFKTEIEYILNHATMIDNNRQTIMFSATLADEIQILAKSYLKPNYIFVAVGEIGGACKDVVQEIIEVSKFEKKKELLKVLKSLGDCQGTMVFVQQKRNADFIAAFLSENNIPTTSIHGDRQQPEREQALRDFKSSKMKILVATAVAARGLDIKGVNCVINFDMPSSVDEYVHRIGRTGRLGNSGRAVSFYDSSSDFSLASELNRILKQADQEVPPFLMRDGSFGDVDYTFNDIRQPVHTYDDGDKEDDW